MRHLVPIGILVVLVVALGIVMHGIQKSAPPDHDDDATPPPAASTAASTPASATPAAPAPPEELPAEQALGSAGAKTKLLVGWVYDDVNQPNPAALEAAIAAIGDIVAKSGGTVSAEIVDVDVPQPDRSPAAQEVTGLGIEWDGGALPQFTGNLGEGALTAQALKTALPAALKTPGG